MLVFPLALATIVAMAPSNTPLTFEQRVEAQRAIERVYWEHRIWPVENPGSKPPLEKVLPDDALRARVSRALKLSNALAVVWGRPVDGAQLQAEMRRMALSSNAPGVLQELLDVLGRDPRWIAEMLARPALVERLARNHYAGDDRFHGELRRQAEAALGQADLMDAGGVYHEERWSIGDETLAQPASEGTVTVPKAEWQLTLERLSHRVLEEDATSFRVSELLAREGNTFTVAVAVWEKVPFDTWFADREKELSTSVSEPTTPYVLLNPVENCVSDTWRPTRTGVPDGRREHSALWTGTEMIVWGGTGYMLEMNSGGRYDPATDTWKPISRGAGVPSPRTRHTAVGTGTEMIVWGGRDDSGPLGNGGVYDPSTDTWQPITAAPGSPAARSGHTAVWTGSEMIVWGGEEAQGCGSGGGRYDPASKDWSVLSQAGPSPRCLHTAIWTGSRMIVWGGYTSQNVPLDTGGVYDPKTDKWVATSAGADVPLPRAEHSAVWTGKEMIVYGGRTPIFEDTQLISRSGARFDPVTNVWTPIAEDLGRFHHTAVWTGKEMILWGGTLQAPGQYGSRYDPSTNEWTLTSPRFLSFTYATAVWTGTEVIVWGGNTSTGGRYAPATDTWVSTSTSADVPVPRMHHTMVWTGAEMIVWGGYSPGNGGALRDGKRYDPAIDDWKHVPEMETSRYLHSAVWTGTEMIVWGGFGWPGYENSGGRYSPTADTWTPTSTGTDVPSPRTSHHAFWTGTEMLVWAGAESRPTSTGGLYDPVTDSWRATSTGANVPLPGDLLAVWTGHEMIAWGAYRRHFDAPVQITGGRFDPA
ncbi:MAG TPA: kelch repeat-containing protein, partial [Candidatus Polarisedimenticolaceae bacterium]|nr:kelch repeat-containing protein [Candidatus Polarisedimenticolaceae bacterium]